MSLTKAARIGPCGALSSTNTCRQPVAARRRRRWSTSASPTSTAAAADPPDGPAAHHDLRPPVQIVQPALGDSWIDRRPRRATKAKIAKLRTPTSVVRSHWSSSAWTSPAVIVGGMVASRQATHQRHRGSQPNRDDPGEEQEPQQRPQLSDPALRRTRRHAAAPPAIKNAFTGPGQSRRLDPSCRAVGEEPVRGLPGIAVPAAGARPCSTIQPLLVLPEQHIDRGARW